MEDSNKDVLNQFREKKLLYSEFTNKLHTLIVELLTQNNINSESIQSRTKSENSFLAKILRPGKNYSDPIGQITDLAGIRIVLHYIGDVSNVAKLIEKEFTIDKDNSVDKSTLLKPNEFGYISLHYVVSLNNSRSQLTEWRTFEGLKAEIQIRTILQHAWASISRELDYTQENEIPSELRRKLFRLSGLLELADEEFLSIAKKQSQLRKTVSKKIDQGNIDLEINNTTLNEYIVKSELVSDIFNIALNNGFQDLDYIDTDENFPRIIQICRDQNISTIKELNELLSEFMPNIPNRLKELVDEDGWGVSRPFIILLLLVIIYYEYIDIKYLVAFGWSKSVAEEVLQKLKETKH